MTAAPELAPDVVTVTTPDGETMIRAMLTLNDAIDLWLGDLARRGRAMRTRDNYRRILYKLADAYPRDWDVSKLTADDCGRFLDRWADRSKGTQAQVHAPLAGLFRWLYQTRRIRQNPMEFVPTVTRQRPEDLDVTTVSTDEVRALLEAGQTWAERLAVAIPCYLGPRRHAAALLRLTDYDRPRRRMRFREKGSKVVWKPVPTELANLIDAAITAGAITEPDGYLIPPEGALRKPGDRDDRVVWRLVTKVAARAGVKAHVHALRAAFAVFYLESGHGDRDSLQALMGHRSPATTEVYLRRLDRETRMESVRALSWMPEYERDGLLRLSEASGGVGAGGFEPPYAPIPPAERVSGLRSEEDLDAELLRVAAEAVRELEEQPA